MRGAGMMSNMRTIDREHVYLYVGAVALMFSVYMQWWPPASLFSAAIVPENNSFVRTNASNSTAIPAIRIMAHNRASRWRFAALGSPRNTCSYSVKNSPRQPKRTIASARYSASSRNVSLDQNTDEDRQKITKLLAHMKRQRHAQIILMIGVLFVLALRIWGYLRKAR